MIVSEIQCTPAVTWQMSQYSHLVDFASGRILLVACQLEAGSMIQEPEKLQCGRMCFVRGLGSQGRPCSPVIRDAAAIMGQN